MATRKLGCWLALTAMLVNAGGPALAQTVVAPVPPPPQPTLWSFLGIPQAYKAVREGAINRSGNRPGLEKKPPLKKISDPANLLSENPAIKKAAEIKKEEDLKWQKIKAIKYLTTIGCGCYNRDGSITDALMKAMDDCTEEVRYATVLAITGAAGGEMCENCKMRSCCSEEVSNKLYELAYERDDEGCFLEPSERVRLAAAEALRVCCPGRGDGFFEAGPPPAEIPQGGEQPGIVPVPGGERPLDPPPPVPTPALPPPPVPQPTLRPISDPYPPRSEIQAQPIPHRHIERAAPTEPVAALPQPRQELTSTRQELATPRQELTAPRQELTTVELPRHQVRVSQPVHSEIRVSAAPSPIVTPAEAPPRVATRPITATPIINPTIPAAAKPAATEPTPAPTKQTQSSRRTAQFPAAADSPLTAAASQSATTPSPGGESAPRTASAPFAKAAPHWTVGARTPAVFISQPIEPAKPIAAGHSKEQKPAAPSVPPVPAEVSAEAMAPPAPAEHLAPIVPPSSMRRLPPPSDAPPAKQSPAPGKTKLASQRLPAPLPVAKQRPAQPRELPGDRFGAGTIESVRAEDGVVLIEFTTAQTVPPGSVIRAYHHSHAAPREAAGDLEVLHSKGNVAIAVPYNGSDLAAFSIGDQAIVLR